MENEKGSYSRIREIKDTKGREENEKIYEVIRKSGIRYMSEQELQDILSVIQETLTEAFKEGNEAQDILLYEGEKPEIRVKGKWQILEQCRHWNLDHFNYFLFNMSQISTKDRDGRYFIGEEVLKSKEGKLLGKPVIEYVEDRINIRSKRVLSKYGNRFLDRNFFSDLMRERGSSYDFSLSKGEHILRCHVYSVYGVGERQEAVGLAIRVVPKEIPKLHELNLTKKLEEIIDRDSGLFLVSGLTGVGKTTTIASLVNLINHDQRKRKIVTIIDDPIEFIHKSQNARIVQRRLGDNVPSYERATEDSLRESSDIVVLGEIKTKDEIANSLRLAETGKLVIASIHAQSLPDTAERFVGAFPDEMDQYRRRLLENLVGISHQNLIVYGDEQFPLSSLLLLEGEESRKVLRDGEFTRDTIAGLLEGTDDNGWTVSQQDWFNEKERQAYRIREKIEDGEVEIEDLPNHERKLLKLLEEDAREVILGVKDISEGLNL